MLAACFWAGSCWAQPQWPDTPESRVFRQRVIDLAVLYGEASGLDEQGFLIHGKVVEPAAAPCKTVAVDIRQGGALVRQENFLACPKAQ